ncbi:unnamed protein product [Alopecurus aequalis]
MVCPGLPSRPRPPGKAPLTGAARQGPRDRRHALRAAATGLPGGLGLGVNAAVLCAWPQALHTDHGDCPFLVAFVFSHPVRLVVTSACVYSSETQVWVEITSIHVPYELVSKKPTALVGNSLYWLQHDSGIIQLDLDKRSLVFFGDVPEYDLYTYNMQILIMPAEDRHLGFAGVDGFSLHLWSAVFSFEGVVTWARRTVINLKKLLAPEAVAMCMSRVEPVGYAEDAGVIFIYVDPGLYMIHLKSMHVQEVSEKGAYSFVFPYTSFYRSR